jgi:hypothetical protein
VFGSATAISFGLVGTVIIFLFLRGDEPQLTHELPSLLLGCGGFLALSAISGGCLYLTMQRRRWHWVAQITMWLGVFLIGFAYWPKR